MEIEHILVSDEEYEGQVVGYLLAVGNNALNEIGIYLSADTFTVPKYRVIYKAIREMADEGKLVSITSVHEQLKRQQIETSLDELIELSMFRYTITIKDCAKRLHSLERRRALNSFSRFIEAATENEEVEMGTLYNQMQDFINASAEEVQVANLETAGQEVLDRVMDNMKGDRPSGTLTGFSHLDQYGGLHYGDLVVIAGDTSNGKTSLALSIAYNAIMSGAKIAYYSLEMTRVELTARLVAIRSKIPSSLILYKPITPGDYDKVYDTLNELPKHNLLFDDKATITFEGILSSIRAMKQNANIDGAIVDYMQILNVNNKGKETQEQVMAVVARRLKNLARELGIWIMALSQINRNQQDPQPALSRLRNSGQIAEAADIVLLVYRPETYGKLYTEPQFKAKPTHNTALIDIAKGRNIGLGKFICRFEPKLTYFYEDFIEDLSDIDREKEREQIKAMMSGNLDDEEELPF